MAAALKLQDRSNRTVALRSLTLYLDNADDESIRSTVKAGEKKSIHFCAKDKNFIGKRPCKPHFRFEEAAFERDAAYFRCAIASGRRIDAMSLL